MNVLFVISRGCDYSGGAELLAHSKDLGTVWGIRDDRVGAVSQDDPYMHGLEIETMDLGMNRSYLVGMDAEMSQSTASWRREHSRL